MLKALLFDLDETLLQLRLNRFLYNYFSDQIQLIAKITERPSALIAPQFLKIMKELSADRTDALSNQEYYYQAIEEAFNLPLYDPIIADCFSYYQQHIAPSVLQRGVHPYIMPHAQQLIDFAKGCGLKLILATNPITPRTITLLRLSWTGINPQNFYYVSSLENSHRCKPHHSYYQEILDVCELYADECIMIGNDPSIDIVQKDHYTSKNTDLDIFKKRDALELKTFLLSSQKTRRYVRKLNEEKNHARWLGSFAAAEKLISELL